jgi:hypothetical protein
MTYFVIRDGQSYGGYSLADLQRYVADGSISMNDMARSEAMPNLLTVQQILGNIPPPPVYVPPPNYGEVPGYIPQQQATAGPMPPGMNWGLLLFLYLVTCGLFGLIWVFVQASFVKKIKPDSSALMWYAIGAGGLFVSIVVAGMAASAGSASDAQTLVGLMEFGCSVIILVGHYSLRSSLEEYYNSTENIGLTLGGVMTFFFNTIYFQYHFNRIQRWKQTGVLS